MEILDKKVFKGRNIYSHKPVIQLTVDAGSSSDIPTKDIDGFNEKLLSFFPSLKKHTCSLGYEGGFLERLQDGTLPAHVLEHLIIDMQNTLGYKVKYGKTIKQDNSLSTVNFEYENEEVALECSQDAVDILNRFASNESISIDRIMERLYELKDKTDPGPSTAAILQEAKKRNIPVTRLDSQNLFRIGYGKSGKLMQATLTELTSCIAADICSDKNITKSILADIGIPVPKGYVVYDTLSAVDAAYEIGLPVVVKPLDSNQGKGVQLNLNEERKIEDAYYNASKYSSKVIVEKYVEGNDYRVLVVGGKVSAVAQRLPAMVTGDGVHTLDELIDIANDDPKRGEGHSRPLTKIKIDREARTFLQNTGISLRDIPQKDQIIKLRANGNISTGGTAIDCTDIIHPDNIEIAVKSAKALGVDIAGIDIIAPDISQSILTAGGAVIEVNAAPGIRMHLYPSEGKPRNIAEDIVDNLFPDGINNFDLVSVSGTNGKTTTVRLIAHVLKEAGKTVGMTNTGGTYINDKCISKGDHSGPESARQLLAHKEIDAAVLETARGGIIRSGLGYDLADVGVITNVSEDHLGLDGIETLEDMANVKSLITEAVKPEGYAVLNAEDPMTNLIANYVHVKPVYFYTDADKIKVYNIQDSINVFIDNGSIKIKDSEKIITVQKIDEIPITFNGLAECNVSNCLAAVSALYALNTPLNAITEGLKSFVSNTGRFQFFEMKGYRIMLDYAHNIAGYEEVINFCKKTGHNRLIGVIGVPGDRSDESARRIGAMAAENFDVIYIKEDIDLRNRAKGEICILLEEAVKNAGKESKIINDETDALKEAIKNAQPDDLIVVFYEKLEPLIQLINENIDLNNTPDLNSFIPPDSGSEYMIQ